MGTVASVLERKREHWSRDEADQHRMVTQWRSLLLDCVEGGAMSDLRAGVEQVVKEYRRAARNAGEGPVRLIYNEIADRLSVLLALEPK
jgi:hypothetical protein